MNTIAKMAPGADLVEMTKSTVKTTVSEKFDSKTAGKGGPRVNYAQIYLKALQDNPLRTKMLTSGSLMALQELLASVIAKDRPKHGTYLTPRVPKMAAYGAFISAPLGHVLISLLQRVFANHTSTKSKILQILVSNLLVSPLQNVVMLASLAYVNGARTFHQVKHDVKKGFLPVMKVSWVTSPIALIIAQKFLPKEAWVPFFNVLGFVIGTYINSEQKKRKLAAVKRRKELMKQEGGKYWESSSTGGEKKEKEYYRESSSSSRRD